VEPERSVSAPTRPFLDQREAQRSPWKHFDPGDNSIGILQWEHPSP